jgi:hypothetical protein
MDTDDVRTAILLLEPTVGVEHVASVIGKLATLKARVKELDAFYTERMTEYVLTHGPVVVGDVEYRVGTEPVTECHDVPGCIMAILDATGGDLDKLAGLLRSQPVKYGEAKGVLGERWGDYFNVTWKRVLKDGKPAKKLLAVNRRFIEGRRTDTTPST